MDQTPKNQDQQQNSLHKEVGRKRFKSEALTSINVKGIRKFFTKKTNSTAVAKVSNRKDIGSVKEQTVKSPIKSPINKDQTSRAVRRLKDNPILRQKVLNDLQTSSESKDTTSPKPVNTDFHSASREVVEAIHTFLLPLSGPGI